MLADSCYVSVPERMPAVTATSTDDSRAIERFLRAIERRALRMAEFTTSNREEALDMVQDAMFGFMRHYGERAAGDWSPLWRNHLRAGFAVRFGIPPSQPAPCKLVSTSRQTAAPWITRSWGSLGRREFSFLKTRTVAWARSPLRQGWVIGAT